MASDASADKRGLVLSRGEGAGEASQRLGGGAESGESSHGMVHRLVGQRSCAVDTVTRRVGLSLCATVAEREISLLLHREDFFCQ